MTAKTVKTLLAALALLPCAATCRAAAPRAVWMWEKESYAIVEDTAAAREAADFLKAAGIGTIYLYADAFEGRNLVETSPELYRRLLRQLHADGLRAYALLGSAYLHTEEYVLPQKRAQASAMFKRILAYNAAAKPAERFDGVNLDIEPHILDQWSSRKNELLLQFLDLGRALMRLKRASGQRLAVGPAIPFWLDGVTLRWRGRTRPVSEHAQDIYDYVALMDYRDHAEGRDGMISHAASELAYATRRGSKVVIGVETTPNEIKKVSFNHLAPADLERELALAEKAFAKEPSFAGFVLHHYRGYRKWLEEKQAPATPK